MTLARILLAVVAIGTGAHYWDQHRAAVVTESILASGDDFGFIDLPRAQGQRSGTVYVVAAVNCPHEAAQRADRLAKDLIDEGIPTVRTDNVRFSSAALDKAALKRLHVVMTGPLPIVFVNGKAKPAAALEDVEEEYRSVVGQIP